MSLHEAEAVEVVLHDDLLAALEQELRSAAVTARPVVVSAAFPARALQAIAERDGADLIVVGAPHRAGAERVLGGDVAVGTLRAAAPPVMVAPVGFAGAPAAAAQRRARLRRLDRVACRPAAGRAAGRVRPARRCASSPSHRPRCRRTRPPRSPRAEPARPSPAGPPRSCFCCSADLDLLVVVSRAQGPVRRLLLGSTSARSCARDAARCSSSPVRWWRPPPRKTQPSAATR